MPALDVSARAALEQLADIAVPDSVPWIPETWGWAALGTLVVAVAVWALLRWRRHREANRYRRDALAELTRLEGRLGDEAGRAEALAALPGLLKRVALAAWPRQDVAALSGAAWVTFLRRHGGGAAPDALTRLLQDGENGKRMPPLTVAEARIVTDAAREWIARHRV
jgi:hypothetical protein